MTERLDPTLERAQRFARVHVHVPFNYGDYVREVEEKYREAAEEALAAGLPIKPIWLRRNGDSSSEFSACVDYILPVEKSVLYLATIDISSDGGHSEIQVLLPHANGSGELVVASQEPYNDESLSRAIELVETTVKAED